MNGTISTFGPVFSRGFRHGGPWTAFQVRMASSLGAGSIGFAEALADDGKLLAANPLSTRVGLSAHDRRQRHTWRALPYLIPKFYAATVIAAVVVVLSTFVANYL